MKELLRVLIVEDSETDFALVARSLSRDCPQCEFIRVESAEAMRAALTASTWDAIISDWSLPTFSALAALNLLHEMGLDLPFIIVSGTVGEEAAVEAMRAGAHDYVLKDHLARLVPALKRELRESKMRQAQSDVQRTLVERTAKLAGMNADLERTQGSLRAAVLARDEFLSIASHELRTPLTSLKLHVSSLIRNRKSTPSVAAQLKTIDRQADRLTTLITQLMDVTRITGNRLQLDPEEMDLAHLVGDVTSRFAIDLKQCGSELLVHAPTSVRGSWDRERMDQVITNLLSNAIKFGCGRPIEVSIGPSSTGARLLVCDHGRGIDPSSVPRIFERFERAVSTRNFGGLGLGLWIVRQIVDASGGTIAVQSELGKGSTFIVEIPSSSDCRAPIPSARVEATILVIDDDPDIREALEMTLTKEGYAVALAPGGSEALTYLRSHSHPSLILLDLMMPGMDGYGFRAHQLADPELASIPVVVTTGAGAKSLRTSELRGATVLIKPLGMETLVAAIDEHRWRCPASA